VWEDGVTPPKKQEFDGSYKDDYGDLYMLRLRRDHLLRETDWWAVSDRTMTQEQTAYRQALRDLPATYPTAFINPSGSWQNVSWPVLPEV
jgi:hypothetical protein